MKLSGVVLFPLVYHRLYSRPKVYAKELSGVTVAIGTPVSLVIFTLKAELAFNEDKAGRCLGVRA
jgi:hypothetical protein